jgi:putative phage-type endonuclease
MKKSSQNWIPKAENRDEWLADRKNYIGASEVASILGLDKYRTPLRVFQDKTEEQKSEMSEIGSQRAEAGLRAENMVSDWIADKYGLKIQRDNKIRIHPVYNFFRCNLDRVIVSHPSGPGVLEIKTTSRENLKTWGMHLDEPNPIFMHHWVQVQAQLAITGYTWGVIGVMPADSFMGFGEPELIEVEPDEDFIPGMVEKIADFWKNHIETKTPPEPTTLEDVQSLYAVAHPPALELNEEAYQKIVQLSILKKQIKTLTEQAREIDLAVRIMMGESDEAIYNGSSILTLRNRTETTFLADDFIREFPEIAKQCFAIDPKIVKELYPEYYKKYVQEMTGSRVLRLKIKDAE